MISNGSEDKETVRDLPMISSMQIRAVTNCHIQRNHQSAKGLAARIECRCAKKFSWLDICHLSKEIQLERCSSTKHGPPSLGVEARQELKGTINEDSRTSRWNPYPDDDERSSNAQEFSSHFQTTPGVER